jgi:hypothetical protein
VNTLVTYQITPFIAQHRSTKEAQMRAAVDACKKNDQSEANLHLKKVADLARDIGYL